MTLQTDNFAPPPAPRVVSAAPASPQEQAIERALRPKLLQEYVGQVKAREQLEIFIGAARQRGEALHHVLLFVPPGLGKPTLSHIIAAELGVNLRQTSGPVLEKPKDLAALLTNLENRDVLFIDEFHRLSPVVEEILYPALEDYQIDIMIGEGPAARSIKLDLQPFTLVGATTRAGMLTNPLRDRFGIVARLEFYSAQELARIVKRSAGLLRVPMDDPRGLQAPLPSPRPGPAGGPGGGRGGWGAPPPLARHAAHRQPAAAARARLHPGQGRRPHHQGHCRARPGHARRRPRGPGRDGPQTARSRDPPLRRRPRRAGQHRRQHWRRNRHHRRRDRALSDTAGFLAAHTARTHRHAGRLPAPGDRRSAWRASARLVCCLNETACANTGTEPCRPGRWH